MYIYINTHVYLFTNSAAQVPYDGPCVPHPSGRVRKMAIGRARDPSLPPTTIPSSYQPQPPTTTTTTTTTTSKTITTTLHFSAPQLPFQLQLHPNLHLQLQLHCAASNHFSVHQWTCSPMHDSEQPTSYTLLCWTLPPPPCTVHTGMTIHLTACFWSCFPCHKIFDLTHRVGTLQHHTRQMLPIRPALALGI